MAVLTSRKKLKVVHSSRIKGISDGGDINIYGTVDRFIAKASRIDSEGVVEQPDGAKEQVTNQDAISNENTAQIQDLVPDDVSIDSASDNLTQQSSDVESRGGELLSTSKIHDASDSVIDPVPSDIAPTTASDSTSVNIDMEFKEYILLKRQQAAVSRADRLAQRNKNKENGISAEELVYYVTTHDSPCAVNECVFSCGDKQISRAEMEAEIDKQSTYQRTYV